MDPPSPTKFPMSPGMPIFSVSPERANGVRPPYGGPAPSSPSLPDLRTSPLRTAHRRNDSNVSVHGLTAMFENLEVKDFKEAQAKYKAALEKQQAQFTKRMNEMEEKHRLASERYAIRCDELKTELKSAKEKGENTIDKDVWDKHRQEYREAIAKWEGKCGALEERRRQADSQIHKVTQAAKDYQLKNREYKKKNQELSKENLRISGAISSLQAKIQSLERHAKLTESDLKFHRGEAEKYKNQVYGLQVDLESVEARLNDELQTTKDRLALVEGERDALKTSLKEEEVMRIAAEGQIPLPTASTDEHDEFESPVRSPRKQRTPELDEEDKENVAPKKSTVELKFLQNELTTEKRLRERAEEQIDFMKMECQFRCCSCRIADLKGADYVHDNSYDAEMQQIKASVPHMTPPPSSHGDDPMEGVVIKQEPIEEDMRAFTPPPEAQISEQSMEAAAEAEAVVQEPIPKPELEMATDESVEMPQPSVETVADNEVAFSPTTGTFKALPSPVKEPAPAPTATPARAPLSLSAITETNSSPWAPDANSTVIHHEPASPTQLRVEPEADGEEEEILPEPTPQPPQQLQIQQRIERQVKAQEIIVHEDAIEDDDEDENEEPQTPLHGPSGPATPAQYLMRTITTTTTVPLHFSPATPAWKKTADDPMTPSTVAHAPTTAQSHILGEISLNKLPIDREAALEQIRLRRGRARSMAAGHGTPRKQMMEGVKERRDISAPVNRVRR